MAEAHPLLHLAPWGLAVAAAVGFATGSCASAGPAPTIETEQARARSVLAADMA